MEELSELGKIINEFKQLLDEFGTSVFDVRVFWAVCIAIIVLLAEIVWMKKHKYVEQKAEKAKKLGHIIKAKLLNSWDDGETKTEAVTWVYATYSYEVNGKEYRYKYMDRASAPAVIELYYLDEPAKSFRAKKNKKLTYGCLFYLFPVLIAVCIIIISGVV